MATGIMQRRRSAREKKGFRKSMRIITSKDNSAVNTSTADPIKKPSRRLSFAFFRIWSRNTHSAPAIPSKPVVDEEKSQRTTSVEPVTKDIILPASPCDIALPLSPTEEQVSEEASGTSEDDDISSEAVVIPKEQSVADVIPPIDDIVKDEVVERSQSPAQEKKALEIEPSDLDEAVVIAPEDIPLPSIEGDDFELASEVAPVEAAVDDFVNPDHNSTNQIQPVDHDDKETTPKLPEAAQVAEEVNDVPVAAPKKPLEIDTARSRRDSPPRVVLSPKASSFTNSIPKSPTEPFKPSRRNSLFGRFGSLRTKRSSKRMTVLPSMKEANLFMQNLEDEDAKRKTQSRVVTTPIAVPQSPRPEHERGVPVKQGEISGSGFGQDVYF